ncbi:STRESS-RESPONSE A/B BARREL DOMAIN-CONTAINING PROTEIN HS1 [Salix purpurea]|uniref:STRESS-RESPONSE A/B BARREL DOMAIN-CONTAINING PROTEIN HS1 n=1 Tax=Salix purpurea TaxID=77065 RepID=A0A9Q0Z284_SALPP|nr:STRESS-RESPONSE A/B BARREL DOMAIN-CONTAINING PROTEIN HS1 [Salix purpurea]
MATKTPKLVKHTLLTRFKDEITRDQIDKYINDYTYLIDLIPSMKSFSWGTDLGMESAELNRGYTHAFESTFESLAGLQEYLDSAALDAFAKDFLPTLSQRLVIDYFLY